MSGSPEKSTKAWAPRKRRLISEFRDSMVPSQRSLRSLEAAERKTRDMRVPSCMLTPKSPDTFGA